MESPRLAAAQTVPFAGDVVANLAQHVALAKSAAAEGVSLLVFPELSLTGYELTLAPALAFTADDARLRPLVSAARVHDMTLVVGAPLRAASGLHIAAFVIEPTGALQLYTKHHLGAFRPEDNPEGAVPPAEDKFFAPGTLNPLVSWRGKAVALSICADSAYPAHFEAAAARGASLYLSSQFAISAHMAFKMSRLKAACRRGLTVVFSNYGGPTGGVASAGGSCVRAGDGSTVVQLPAEGAGLAIAWDELSLAGAEPGEKGARWAGKAVLTPHA